MSFLLVITLATVALAVPHLHDSEVAFNLSTSQSQQYQQQNASRQGFHTQDNPVTNWKDENFRYSQLVPLRHKKSFGQSFVLAGYKAQAQHTQRAAINSNVSENVYQNQGSSLRTTAGNTQSNSPLASFNNNYESSSQAGINKKPEPAQRLKASSKPNKYNGFKSVSPRSYYRLKSGGKMDVQTTPGFVTYNQGFTQVQTLQGRQGRAPGSSGYMKKSNVRPASKNRYMHVLTTFAGTNKKFDLASSLLPEIKIRDINKNNAYTQTTSPALKTYNNVYVKERGSSLVNSNFNNDKENIGILRASANSGLDYSLSHTSSSGNEHDVFATRVTNSSSTAVIPSAGQPQATQRPSYVDLKKEIMKVPQLGSTLGDGYQSILATGDSLNALTEKKNNSAMKFASEGIPKLLSPIIHKHIFFHVPPPDLEESITVIPSAKKSYNILFIKGPPQDLETNHQKPNEVPHRKDVAVNDKTLIYVLLKNSEETNKIILPKPKPTAQQVLDLQQASQVNDELDKNESIDNIVPLGPDLVNGQQD